MNLGVANTNTTERGLNAAIALAIVFGVMRETTLCGSLLVRGLQFTQFLVRYFFVFAAPKMWCQKVKSCRPLFSLFLFLFSVHCAQCLAQNTPKTTCELVALRLVLLFLIVGVGVWGGGCHINVNRVRATFMYRNGGG